MSFVAEASRTISATPEVLFDRLADYGSWDAWMPRSFEPMGHGVGPLQVGDRIRVRILGLPSELEITVADRGRELAWRGGIGFLLSGEHRFIFERDGASSTRVRSVELWRGLLGPLVRPVVRRVASSVGKKQLAGLARPFVT